MMLAQNTVAKKQTRFNNMKSVIILPFYVQNLFGKPYIYFTIRTVKV